MFSIGTQSTVRVSPLEVKKYPALRDAGAFSNVEKFTQLDIADIVEYASPRGVRVMVEFDVPGHAQSWCKGIPDICPSSTCTHPLNVASPKTFDVIGEIIGECTGGNLDQRQARGTLP